jgi:dihydropteroate synthase
VIWRARTLEFRWPRPPLVLGVINVTPDSFSDGGQFQSPLAAIAAARQLVEEGADLIDIGGESTRPGAIPVPEQEEIERVVPIIRALRQVTAVPISIDTRKPEVAAAALAAGAEVINDVGAATASSAMWELLRTTGAGYICMHMQGTPATMQLSPHYEDVVGEVDAFLSERLDSLLAAGVNRDQIVLDPGIGFGKRPEHNVALVRECRRFTRHGRPVLLGVSRKSFLGHCLQASVAHRLPGALACSLWGASQGIALFRTHDVEPTVHALRMHRLLETPAA